MPTHTLKTRPTPALAAAALSAALAPLGAAHASLIAEENFDYGVSDAPLAGLNGGTGWATAWENAATDTGYDADVNLTIDTTGYFNAGNVGGSATIGDGAGSNIHPREIATAATTLWVSALGQVDQANGRALIFLDGTFANNGNSDDFIGVDDGVAAFRYNDVDSTGAAATLGETFLLIAKIELDVAGGNDRLSFWFDPANVSSEAALGSATFSDDTADVFGAGFDGVALIFDGSGRTPGNLDAIRVGAELVDVTGIPEPSTLALAAIGGALAFGRRR